MGMGQNFGGNVRSKYGGAEVYVDMMFNLGGAAPAVNTATQMNFGTGGTAGNYAPSADGNLVALAIMLTPQAATSNAQSGFVALSCPQWTPKNAQNIPFTGFGLATAPQVYGGSFAVTSWTDLFLPVKTSVPITGFVTYTYPSTPVTPNIVVTGIFTAKMATAAAP